MPLRALFLDVGQTLLTVRPSRFALYADAACRHGREIDPAAMRRVMAGVHRELPLWLDGSYRYSDPWFTRFIELVYGDRLALGAAEVAAITEELFERFEDPASFEVFAGAHELLARVRERGLVLGVISNWSARLPRLLERLGLAGGLDFVLSSALEGAEKPAAVLFERALERAGVGPAEALHAGDHPVLDVEAAAALGLQTALVDHGPTEDEPRPRPELPELQPDLDAPPPVRVTSLPALTRLVLERAE